MKYIISGTNRKDSRTRQVATIIQKMYAEESENVEVIDLATLPLHTFGPDTYGKDAPEGLKEAIDKVNHAEGVIFVVPEYNGSLPGALKLFIDHWKYPESFEYRPVCYVGLGGMFGGLRPVEHLQQIMAYRNSFQFPDRVFLSQVWNQLKDGNLQDPLVMGLLKKQTQGFIKFCKALQSQALDANAQISRMVKK